MKNPYLWGFYNSDNNIVIQSIYQGIDMDNFDKNIIYVKQNDKMGYITSSGKQIWIERNANINTENFNIDYMNRAYFIASSANIKKLNGFGGWAHFDTSSKHIDSVGGFEIRGSGNLETENSGNSSQPIMRDLPLIKGQLQVIIDTKRKATFAERYNGVKLFVINSSNDSLFFDAQDSRIYLNIQAKDRDGKWKDIEYFPSSWCGNSYHSLFLAPNQLWEFTAPIYHGEFKTKLRAKLLYKNNVNQKDDVVIYSNEYQGSVNPGQFWRKQEYNPNGIMDPYND